MELEIANVKVSDLLKRYPTPLYVYNQEVIEENLQVFRENFQSEKFATKILYASKAFQAVALLNLIADAGLGLDVVSQGELYAASKSRMPLENIYFHGNNKSPEELLFAILNVKISHIVVDNKMELEVVSELASLVKRPLQILLRLNVGIEAHTHQYVITSHVDSKFGMGIESQELKDCLKMIETHPFLVLEGLHSHIGSQIFELTAWFAAIEKLTDFLHDLSEQSEQDEPLALNIGGGFGVRYTQEDKPLPIDQVLRQLIHHVEKCMAEKNVRLKALMIEPGRSLVAEAGLTLYKIGYQKVTPNKNYLFVDGGMGDNIRPSLYQAKYDCDLALRLGERKTERFSIAGKYCESADILIENAELPKPERGDILVVYGTGAYGYSMASNYNRNVIPGVVFLKDGKITEVVKRQTLEQLLENEVY
ncbi:diaminopimelate decarboxylase [Lactovum odontotermitis]